MLAPLSNSIYRRIARAHTRTPTPTTDGHPNIPVSRVSDRFTRRQVPLASTIIPVAASSTPSYACPDTCIFLATTGYLVFSAQTDLCSDSVPTPFRLWSNLFDQGRLRTCHAFSQDRRTIKAAWKRWNAMGEGNGANARTQGIRGSLMAAAARGDERKAASTCKLRGLD